MKRRLFCCTLAAVFAGCTASPVHYHTLMPTKPLVERSPRPPADFVLNVMPVTVPPSLDQAFLAIRRGKTEIAFLDDERWASPLASEIRAALSAALSAGLQTEDVAGLAPGSAQRIATVKIEIRRLDVWPGNRVELRAAWRVTFSDRKQSALTCVTELQQPTRATDYGGIVQDQQAVILQLADVIEAKVLGFERVDDCLAARQTFRPRSRAFYHEAVPAPPECD